MSNIQVNYKLVSERVERFGFRQYENAEEILMIKKNKAVV